MRPGTLLPYWQVARRSFQRYSTYRGATAAGVFTNTVFGFMKVAVLLAVYRGRHRVGTFDRVDVVTFTFVAQGLLATVGAFNPLPLGERIRSGDVVSDLYRPLHFQGYWLAEDLGRAGFQVLARGVPPVLLAALVFDLRLPPGTLSWFVFAASVALGLLVSFACRFMVIVSGFWILDTRGPWQLAGSVEMFFAGFVVPLTLFPGWLERFARLTPFPAVAQLPIEVFLGKHQGLDGAAAVLVHQAMWAALLLALAELVATRAFRKVVVHGG